jgi:hypothetical protein
MSVKRRRSPPPRRRARAAGESLRDTLGEAGRRTFGLLVEAITECPRP